MKLISLETCDLLNDKTVPSRVCVRVEDKVTTNELAKSGELRSHQLGQLAWREWRAK